RAGRAHAVAALDDVAGAGGRAADRARVGRAAGAVHRAARRDRARLAIAGDAAATRGVAARAVDAVTGLALAVAHAGRALVELVDARARRRAVVARDAARVGLAARRAGAGVSALYAAAAGPLRGVDHQLRDVRVVRPGVVSIVVVGRVREVDDAAVAV